MKIFGESWAIRRAEKACVDTLGRAVMQQGSDSSRCLYEVAELFIEIR